MALEIRFKVENLGVAVEKAGYTVIDSIRNEVEKGFTSIAEDGTCIIPITSRWVGLGERLRPTVDDFDGSNFDDSGTATDWFRVTEVYVDFSIRQNGYTVACVNQSGEFTPWDMGDGTILAEEDPVYIYKRDGTYTITNGSFSTTVVVTGVKVFSVTLEGNTITCIRQSGFAGSWDFGNGDTAGDLDLTYIYQENGEFTVSFGDFTVDISVDYYSEGFIKSVVANRLTLNSIGSGIINYGDGSSGTSLTKEFAQDGVYKISQGDLVSIAKVYPAGIPVATISAAPSLEDSSLVTFTGGGGDTYLFSIEDETSSQQSYQHKFTNSGVYDIALNATFLNGNSNRVVIPYTVYTNNTDPTGTIITEVYELTLNLSVDIVDPDLNASHTVTWTIDSGGPNEVITTELSPEYTQPAPVVSNDPAGQTIEILCRIEDERQGVIVLSKQVTLYDFTSYGNDLMPNPAFDTEDLTGLTGNGCSLEVINGELKVTALDGSQNRIDIRPNLETGKTYILRSESKEGTSVTAAWYNFTGVTESVEVKQLTNVYELYEYEFTVLDASAFVARVYVNTTGGVAGDTIFLNTLSIVEKL